MSEGRASPSDSVKPRHVLFITNSYPFGVGEDFAEMELRKLTDFFQVTIFPLDCRGQRRPIELHGADVFVWKGSIVRILWSALRSLISPHFWADLGRAPSILRFLANGRAPLRLLHRHAQAMYLKPHIRLALSENDFGAVYSFWGNSGALCVARLADTPPLLVRLHGYDLYPERNAGLIPGQAEILEVSNRILAVSRQGQQYLQQHYPEKAEAVDYVPIGVPPQPDNVDVRREDALRIVSISYCVSVKRLNIILRAVRVCLDRGVHVKWTHIGGGPLLQSLEQEARMLALGDAARFVGHLAPGAEGLYEHLSQHAYDLALNVSGSEGLPIALQEAMSFGIPIAATQVGGNEELTSHSGGITLEPLVNAEEVATMLGDYSLLNRNSYAGMRHSAQVTQRRLFNAEHGEALCNTIVKAMSSFRD